MSRDGRKKVRVKTAKRRKISSSRWLERQLNDPYVQKARAEGWRSRAAFKLLEMDEKMGLLKKGMIVLDLGAAPGGWSQVAAQKGCRVVAIDLLPIEPPIPNVDFIQMDFMDDTAPQKLKEMLGAQADIVLSDLAPNAIGHKATDHLRIMAAVEAAYEFACEVLKPGGVFVAKVWQGGAQHELLAQMKKDFKTVRHVKPPSSRKDSAEQFVAAAGFRG